MLQREDRINEADLEDDENARVKVTSARHIDAREVKRFRGVAPRVPASASRVLDERGRGARATSSVRWTTSARS